MLGIVATADYDALAGTMWSGEHRHRTLSPYAANLFPTPADLLSFLRLIGESHRGLLKSAGTEREDGVNHIKVAIAILDETITRK